MLLRSLEKPPEPLTRSERWIVIAASVVAAISRVFALARTPWDWDELLFMLSLDHFDVARHHPHPPGFPLYILTAHLFRLIGFDDFHALQAVSLAAAIVIVPAMFFFCRELRMTFRQSLSAALLLAFFPNVWLYGGGAFSDVPSMTLILFAAALLLAGCRSPRAFYAGAVVLAISACFRPQNIAVGLAPFLIAGFFRSRRQIATAIVIIGIVILASYGAAASITGWDAYREALQTHRAYIIGRDSFLSPARAPLWRVFDDFFVMPYHAPVIAAIVILGALVAIFRRRPPALIALATFGPLCAFTWLYLDRYSASRFAIGYAPLFAILAADTLSVLCVSAVIYSIFWTWPALMTMRNEISPPVKAVTSIPRAVVFVQTAMAPFAEWYLRAQRIEDIGDGPPPASAMPPSYFLTENPEGFPKGRIWDIVRHRYFDVSAGPIPQRVQFGSGWNSEEGPPAQPWRWMGAHSEMLLPGGSGRLRLSLYVPLDAIGSAPGITIRVDGRVVDQFRATQPDMEREFTVRGRILTIDTDRVARPARDPRVLGLRLNAIVWTTAT